MAAWVSLADFQAFVGNATAADSAVVQAAINLGCAMVEEACGPIVTAAVSEHVPGGGYELPLDAHGTGTVISVSTWPDGVALTASDYVIEDQVVFRKDAGWIDSDLTVTYTVGAASAPDWATGAAKLIGLQWLKSRLRPSQNDPTSIGYLVPNQAKELMATHLLAPDGFA